MQTTRASNIKDEGLLRRIETLHLFREIREASIQQYRLLLDLSQIYHLEPGETIVKPGERDRWLYFVVRGELQVCADAFGHNVLGVLNAGEVFGDIALLTGGHRSAYVRLSSDARPAIVFAADFDRLGNLQDHAEIKLATKIFAYRQIVHSLRWRNDQYRVRFPDDPVANEPYKERPFVGKIGTQEELNSLARQAKSLAERLLMMNQKLGAADKQGFELRA